LFDFLGEIAFCQDKTVELVKNKGIIPGAEFYSEILKSKCVEVEKRQAVRSLWFRNSLMQFQDAKLIFADPDNGISYRKSARTKDCEKYILPEEVEKYYKSGKNIVFYCHKGRRGKEAWEKTKTDIRTCIKDVQILAVTFHRGTQRSYIFVLHPDDYQYYRELLKEFVNSSWGKLFSWELVAVN
jgi:hypothetical protein